MALTNLIINGDFSSSTNNSATGWSGTDIETRVSSVYISGTGNSRVAELNGGTGNVTVMEQTFTVDSARDADLNFDYALRDSGTLGVDGFKVEVLDSNGVVIFTQDIVPDVQSTYIEFSDVVTFPAAGDYTIRFTEIGDNADGSGALLDNVELLVCFSGDTLIKTPTGYAMARDLKAGQLVITQNGRKPIRWIGRRTVDAAMIDDDARFLPVRICQGALGNGLPTRDLLVSRQHRVMARSPIAQRMFGQAEILLAAIRLTDLPGIYVDTSIREIDYFHFLLDEHEVLLAEDAPAETLYLGDHANAALGDDAVAEIDLIFPGLRARHSEALPARAVPTREKQIRFMSRVVKNARPVLEDFTQNTGEC
ncbi:hemolysin [Loktanella sp. D2R18]|uniref:Hint domain-containing protein n=1 Tax=Rhodobacterales TaxID=204455 RepID=UPI000DE8EC08|nr:MULTISPECIES: Hint domain-containing protein [Rhodobacterales]MDO6589789.1 Hint domain-containing protein [Yoonia sp. 1_MG-2023]RBW44408.1 hemolysin [Loktanella sp. D2R18]